MLPEMVPTCASKLETITIKKMSRVAITGTKGKRRTIKM